jgi:hypothetical protein
VRLDHPEQRILPTQSLEPPVCQNAHKAEPGKYYERQPQAAQENQCDSEHEAEILQQVRWENNGNAADWKGQPTQIVFSIRVSEKDAIDDQGPDSAKQLPQLAAQNFP